MSTTTPKTRQVGDAFYADDSGWLIAAIDDSLKRYEGADVVEVGVEYLLEKPGPDDQVLTRRITNWKAA